MKQIIGSEVGADRLDYLHRDSIECNVPYGLVDPRIFNEFSVEGNELVLDKDALPLVDTIFHSLFQMKYAVYDHKASRAVLRMLKEPYKEALRRRRAKRLHLLIESDDFEFLGNLQSMEERSGTNYVKRINLTRNLIKTVYTLGAPFLKHISLVKALDRLQPQADEIEQELERRLKGRFYVDFVPPRPAPAVPIRARVNSESLSLDRSPLLKDWYGVNVDKQWKLFVFCDVTSDTERAQVTENLDNVFGCFGLGLEYEPRERLDAFSDIYPVLKNLERRATVSSLMPELLKLPEHRRKTLVELVKKGSATADELSLATGRSRTIESLYLNKLVEKYLTKQRQGKRTIFKPREELTILFQEGILSGS